MSVSKRKRELLAAARAVCPNATIETTGKAHLKINIAGPGGSRSIFCSQTPSDHRDTKNVKRNIAQAARAVGCIS